MYLVMHFLTLAIYFVGANLIRESIMANKLVLFGDMVVFMSYAMQVIMSFLLLAMIFMMMPRASVSAGRINEVFDTKSSIEDGKIDKDITLEKGIVEFKNVSFKYPDADEYLLENISFKANKGDILVIDAKRMREEGGIFYLSENEVWLCDEVKWQYVIKIQE